MDKQNIVNNDKNRTKGLLIKMRRHKLLSGMISVRPAWALSLG